MIYAEPAITLPEVPDSHLEQHRIQVRPLTTGDKLDKLQAYHANMDLMNAIHSPEQHDLD